ncbi:MAG: hypothetical protein J6W06_11085 [Bacteroidales bacterium]|nr:hypothetical protein [Bacteroidales bacterium]
MNCTIKILLVALLALATLCANAQVDTISRSKAKENEKIHSPKTATLLAIIPGAGQAYNRKYWKMPIVYATMGTCIYFVASSQKQFKRFKTAYMQRDAGETDEFYGQLSKEAIMNNMDSKRTLRDYMFAGALLIYALQIIDANVDAHLFYFDVGDNLSAHFYPQSFTPVYSRTPVFGIGCSISF